jgi:hypothetical protein
MDINVIFYLKKSDFIIFINKSIIYNFYEHAF